MKIENVSKTKLFSKGSLSDYLSVKLKNAKKEITTAFDDIPDEVILKWIKEDEKEEKK